MFKKVSCAKVYCWFLCKKKIRGFPTHIMKGWVIEWVTDKQAYRGASSSLKAHWNIGIWYKLPSGKKTLERKLIHMATWSFLRNGIKWLYMYCMSKKSSLFWYSESLYKNRQEHKEYYCLLLRHLKSLIQKKGCNINSVNSIDWTLLRV